MTTISAMAGFVSASTFDSLPGSTIAKIKLHLLDSLGAMIAGPKTQEGAAIQRLGAHFPSGGNVADTDFPIPGSPLTALMATCAATRSTEIDDIHLESCTTPGSVIVPTVLSLASAGYLSDPREFLVALVVGYELLIRLGLAIDGPNTLYRGVWPTYLVAPLGSAAVTARALKLDKKKTADALACALTLSTGIAGRIRKARSSRWLTLGLAAQNGVFAAFSAADGFAGDDALLDRDDSSPLQALMVAKTKLIDALGEKYHLEETCVKPYPIARQALSAVEAFQKVLAEHEVDPESIEGVLVFVPRQFTKMIDNPKMPESRIESIIGVQYQIALAAFQAASLLDIRRELLLHDRRIGAMMAKVAIQRSEELEKYFPATWPARVEVATKNGVMIQEVLYPRGDWHSPFSQDEVVVKFKQVAFGCALDRVNESIACLAGSIHAAEEVESLLVNFKSLYSR